MHNFTQLLTDDVCPWIKVVAWTGLSGDEPRQSRTLLAVLVLHKPSDLSIVRLPIVFIYDPDHITYLVIHTL